VATVDFPTGYHPELLGEYAERQAAQDRLLLFAIAAVVGIFLLLQASFNDTRLAMLSMLVLPSALVGGIIAAWISGGTISLGSLVGFFTVLGIAARNGIMMINHFQHLERYEGETFGPHLVIRGAQERLAPILMTALATGLALIPLAVAGDLPGHEIEHPMAIVILGGLITSTLLNLFVLPSLYLRFARSARTAASRTALSLRDREAPMRPIDLRSSRGAGVLVWVPARFDPGNADSRAGIADCRPPPPRRRRPGAQRRPRVRPRRPR
jgi:Cu/Ag efflux pump CusA